MSRIEELPDDFDESLDLNALSAGTSAAEIEESYARRYNKSPSTGTDKAPSKSFENIMSEMSQTPLFMNSDDVANEADGENSALEAIRAMQYEGTKAETAKGFKEQGNEMVKVKQWKDAKEFYTKGIAVLTTKGADDKWEKGEEPELEAKKEKELEEQIYVNRALCNLELGNFRQTTLDSASALRLNPTNIKALYRSSSALLSLDKLLEASDCAHRGLQLEPNHSALKTLATKIKTRQDRLASIQAKATAEKERKAKEAFTLYAALSARGIVLKWTEKPPDLEDSKIKLSPDPLSPKSLLSFPILVLYPMHEESDFIKAAAEKNTIFDHLSYLLPAPWDTKKEYTLKDVECYMDTPKGGLIKVGKKLTLLQVLANGKTVVIDGQVIIHVVPAKLAPKWIEEVKRKKGIS